MDRSLVQGTTIADSPRQARDELRQRGLSVHEIHAQSVAADRARTLISRLRPRRSRWSQTRLTGFIRELSTLLGVGMPMLEAIDTIVRQHRGHMKTTLLLLRDRVAAGVSLAEAMREQPEAFDAVTVQMTEVGEHAGVLDQVFNELAAFKERMGQLQGRIGSALIYPGIVLATGVAVSIFLMSYVVPTLLESLIESGRPLPMVTRGVKAVSNALVHHGWLLVMAAAMLAAGAGAFYRQARGRRLVHRALLKLPVLGPLLRKQAVVRIAFITSTLMRSGIAFEKAIATARDSIRNVVLRDALADCERAVVAGGDIGASLEQSQAFPAAVVQVFSLGQQSGRMEEMLDRLAGDYDRQVAASATRLIAVLEPIMILLLAAIVGSIAFATVLPILELGNVL